MTPPLLLLAMGLLIPQAGGELPDFDVRDGTLIVIPIEFPDVLIADYEDWFRTICGSFPCDNYDSEAEETTLREYYTTQSYGKFNIRTRLVYQETDDATFLPIRLRHDVSPKGMRSGPVLCHSFPSSCLS